MRMSVNEYLRLFQEYISDMEEILNTLEGQPAREDTMETIKIQALHVYDKWQRLGMKFPKVKIVPIIPFITGHDRIPSEFYLGVDTSDMPSMLKGMS
jgi:hypothetical protein